MKHKLNFKNEVIIMRLHYIFIKISEKRLKRKINEENKQTKQQKANLNEFSQVVYLFIYQKLVTSIFNFSKDNLFFRIKNYLNSSNDCIYLIPYKLMYSMASDFKSSGMLGISSYLAKQTFI